MSESKQETEHEQEEDLNPIMKHGFQNLVTNIRSREDYEKNTPFIFQWVYPDDPHVQYQLIIIESDQSSFPTEEGEEFSNGIAKETIH